MPKKKTFEEFKLRVQILRDEILDVLDGNTDAEVMACLSEILFYIVARHAKDSENPDEFVDTMFKQYRQIIDEFIKDENF